MFSQNAQLDTSLYLPDGTPLRLRDEICLIHPPHLSPESAIESVAELVSWHVVPSEANKISGDLWKAGRFYEYTRSMTEFRCLGNNFVITDDIKLHMVWEPQTKTMFLKPLPTWCTNYGIVSAIQNHDRQLGSYINAFLYTYSRLIRSRHDFKLAQENSLVLEGTTWEAWCDFINSIQFPLCSLMPGRYRYGPLRLDRLNLIKRTNLRHFELSYFNTSPSYSAYFEGYFQVSILIFAFMSIMLSCAQVILTIQTRPAYIDSLFYYISVLFFWLAISIIIAIGMLFVASAGWFLRRVTRPEE